MYYLLLYIVLSRIHKEFRSTWLLKAYDLYLTGALLTRRQYITRLRTQLQLFFCLFLFFLHNNIKYFAQKWF